jgi:putative redox protein
VAATHSRPRRKSVTLRWSGQGQLFHGGAPGGVEIPIDGDSHAGPSPMDALLLALAGCMAADVLMILQKGRVPVDALEVAVEGERREQNPRRFMALRLEYRVAGPGEEHEAKLERAVALSRDTYCSVLHSLRPDLEVEIRIRRL